MLSILKVFFVVLASVGTTLSACNSIAGKPSDLNPDEAVTTSETNSGLQEATNPSGSPVPQLTASASSQSSTSVGSQKLSQDTSNSESPTSAQAERENYKPISLATLDQKNARIGSEPNAIAIAAFGDVDTEGGSQDVTVEYPQPNLAVVTVTHMGVADDSVRGIRYRAELVPTNKSTQTDKQWEIVWAGSQFTCQPGRGHQDWSTELCL